MKKLLLMPLWTAQIFTQAKSFSKNPVIGNRWLNIMGLHVARMILAHTVMRFRMLVMSRKIDSRQRREYFSKGYILVENFLPAEQHQRLLTEIHSANAEVRECKQGDTLTHRIMLDHTTLPALPECDEVLQTEQLRDLLRFASGKFSPPASYIQTIKNQYIDGPVDPQKNLHSDTFHPTMKSWYFLDDVDESNGPFTYVPGSHRLTFARLKWEYSKSIEISSGSDRYSGNGSLRLTNTDHFDMKLPPPHAFKVAANTLVVANTHGFHCRGTATDKSTRTELWTISRNNPFNPFPGIDHPLTTKLQNRAITLWRKHCDRKAASRGIASSWHVIDARNTIHPE